MSKDFELLENELALQVAGWKADEAHAKSDESRAKANIAILAEKNALSVYENATRLRAEAKRLTLDERLAFVAATIDRLFRQADLCLDQGFTDKASEIYDFLEKAYRVEIATKKSGGIDTSEMNQLMIVNAEAAVKEVADNMREAFPSLFNITR